MDYYECWLVNINETTCPVYVYILEAAIAGLTFGSGSVLFSFIKQGNSYAVGYDVWQVNEIP